MIYLRRLTSWSYPSLGNWCCNKKEIPVKFSYNYTMVPL